MSSYDISKVYTDFLCEYGPGYEELVYIPSSVPHVEVLGRHLANAVSYAVEVSDGSFKLRAFSDFSLNYYATNVLGRTVLERGDTVLDWVKTQEDISCVALNKIASWDLDLLTWFAYRVNEIGHLGKHPLTRGIDTYSFISLKGWTPFGIHKDYEPSFIFHLGPGIKQVWVWPKEGLKNINFIQTPAINGISFDIEENLETAHKFFLEPGDFLCIPANFYHIFHGSEPSIFLGITLFPPRLDSQLTEIFSTKISQSLKNNCTTENQLDWLANFSLTENIHNEFYRSMNIMKSYGYSAPPNNKILEKIPDCELLSVSLFQARFPGVIQSNCSGGLFILGEEFVPNIDIDIDILCDVVDCNKQFSINTFEKHLGLDSLQSKLLMKILYQSGALIPC